MADIFWWGAWLRVKKAARRDGKRTAKSVKALPAAVKPKERMTGWRRDLASDFGKSPAKVQVVKPQGGGEYLRLQVSPDEVEKYLTRKYPGGTRPVRTRARGRPAARAPVAVEPVHEVETEPVVPVDDEETEVEEVEAEVEPDAEVHAEAGDVHVDEEGVVGSVNDGLPRRRRKGRGRVA